MTSCLTSFAAWSRSKKYPPHQLTSQVVLDASVVVETDNRDVIEEPFEWWTPLQEHLYEGEVPGLINCRPTALSVLLFIEKEPRLAFSKSNGLDDRSFAQGTNELVVAISVYEAINRLGRAHSCNHLGRGTLVPGHLGPRVIHHRPDKWVVFRQAPSQVVPLERHEEGGNLFHQLMTKWQTDLVTTPAPTINRVLGLNIVVPVGGQRDHRKTTLSWRTECRDRALRAWIAPATVQKFDLTAATQWRPGRAEPAELHKPMRERGGWDQGRLAENGHWRANLGLSAGPTSCSDAVARAGRPHGAFAESRQSEFRANARLSLHQTASRTTARSVGRPPPLTRRSGDGAWWNRGARSHRSAIVRKVLRIRLTASASRPAAKNPGNALASSCSTRFRPPITRLCQAVT